MVKIVIENLGQKEIISNDSSRSLLRTIHEAGVDWMTGCGGKGRCTTCKAIILEGGAGLPPLSPAEVRYRNMGALAPNERLTCQVRPVVNLRLRVPEEYKLPHLHYSEPEA